MATDEKSNPPSSSYVEPTAQPYAPRQATGYTGQQPVQYQPSIQYPPNVYHPGAVLPAYPQQQQATSVVFAGGVPNQNVLVVQTDVQTVRTNVQIPEVYPGVAFCSFVPGIIETLIRSSVVVMLLVVIAVAGAAIDEESEVVHDKDVVIDARGWRGAAGWIIFAAGLSVITEGIMLLLRFFNPRFFNNFYNVFGGLDITKCVLSLIGLFIGCVITGVESSIAADDIDRFCEDETSFYYIPDNVEACDKMRRIYNIVLALTVVNAVCSALILTLLIWDIVYLSAGFNSKVPVPRGTEQHHQ